MNLHNLEFLVLSILLIQTSKYNPNTIQFNRNSNSQKSRTNDQINTIKCNKFQVYMPTILKQCLLIKDRKS
jgi:hypothetical protein